MTKDRIIMTVLDYIESLPSQKAKKDFVEELTYDVILETGDTNTECQVMLNRVGIATSLWHEGKVIKEKTINTEKAGVLN